jgi:leader peptidase (prepilin peptidase)/N-methyltransferase
MNSFIQLLHDSAPFFIGLTAVLGLLVGSFLNVVIHRLPKMMEREWQSQCAEFSAQSDPQSSPRTAQQDEPLPYNLQRPRSACPHCGHMISALENIPLFSYLLLRGKCRKCGHAISLRYPIVEAITGILSAYAAWHFGFGWPAAGAVIFLWALIALTFIDFDTQLLPDDITLPLLWLGLIFNLFQTYTSISNAVVGAIAGYLVLWSVYWLFKLVTGKEGMGYGDFKFLAAIGAWLGWSLLPLVIMLSSVVGAVVGITLIVATRQGRNIPIPFGPYLAGGALIALFWGEQLTQNYLRLIALP